LATVCGERLGEETTRSGGRLRRGPGGGAGEGDEAATEIRRRSGRGRGGVGLVDDVEVARRRL